MHHIPESLYRRSCERVTQTTAVRTPDSAAALALCPHRRSLAQHVLGVVLVLAAAVVAARTPVVSATAPETPTPSCLLSSHTGPLSWLLSPLPENEICRLLAAARPRVTPTPSRTATRTPSPAPTTTPTRTPPVAPPTTIAVAGEHVVAEGESLSEIALLYGTTAETLAALNEIDDPAALDIGMHLRLPQPGQPTAAVTPSGTRLVTACAPQALERILDLPYETSRLAILDNVLYLLAGGDLYALPLADIDSTLLLEPALTIPSGRTVGALPIQELMDLVIDETTGQVVLLNKVGDLFSYRPATGEWSVRMVGETVPGVWLDPQYIGITQIGAMTYAMEIDGARLWRMPAGAQNPVVERAADHIARAVDVAAMGEHLYLLNANGTLSDSRGRAFDLGIARLGRPVDLNSAGDGLLAVDGDGRRVILLSSEGAIDISLRFPGMQRLRAAAWSQGTVYVATGTHLYRVMGEQTEDACPVVPYDNRYLFNGVDLDKDIPALTLPFQGGVLPSRPRSYPGARRMYRYGVHEGVDFYAGDAPGLAYRSPVGAIAQGTVIRIDHDFDEMTPQAYGPIMAEIKGLHSTPAHLLDKLRGQQVWVEHAPGVVSRYSHLAGVAGDLHVGDTVTAGQVLGRVGVSGTSSGVYRSTDGFHLHWEIWIHGRYLGQGLTLPETMRLWRHLFS